MSAQDPDLAQLRADLLRSARAYLEWETEVSSFGIPLSRVSRTPRPATQPGADAPAPARAPVPGRADEPRAPSAVEAPAASASFGELSRTPAPSLGAHEEVPSAASAAPGEALALPGDKRARLTLLDQQVRGCTRCELAKGRTQTVFARGNPDSRLVFVGEGPGQEEDCLGAPFVGAAGELLDKMVGAMGFARDDVYICNVVKCRPPGNRTPLPAEAEACAPYLLGQLDAVAPRVIVALGRCAAENMGLVAGGGWRGRWGKFRGVDVMPTYHPAFLLRSPEYKRPVWEDLQQVMARLKEPG